MVCCCMVTIGWLPVTKPDRKTFRFIGMARFYGVSCRYLSLRRNSRTSELSIVCGFGGSRNLEGNPSDHSSICVSVSTQVLPQVVELYRFFFNRYISLPAVIRSAAASEAMGSSLSRNRLHRDLRPIIVPHCGRGAAEEFSF